MFDIETYILQDTKKMRFLPYQECDFGTNNLDDLEGAIIIKYYDEIILSVKEWDEVVELWVYFVQGFINLESNGVSEILFPDQPIKIIMKILRDDYILLSIKRKKYMLPKTQFISQMKNKAYDFFMAIDYQYGIRKIYELDNIMK